MAATDPIESRAPENVRLRKWLFLGLAASLLLHLCLFAVFTSTKLERFGGGTERLVPRVFSMSRAIVDPKQLNDSEKEETKPAPERPPIDLPQEAPKADNLPTETRATPSAPDLVQPIINEKPQVGPNNLKALSKLQDNAQKTLEKEFEKYRQEALQDTTKSSELNLAALGSQANANASTGTAPDSVAGNFSTLDSLLAQSGGIQEGTKPILLPTDLLFDFDKTELRPQAVGSLQKLGTLIQRNPNVTFSIEGHTDSFGQQTHNEALSLERANKVKQWLIQTMGVAPASVETKGFGSSHLLVQPDPSVTGKSSPKFTAEVARQQLNRRVEIVMRWQH